MGLFVVSTVPSNYTLTVCVPATKILSNNAAEIKCY